MKLRSYESINDYWEALGDELTDFPTKPIHGKWYQRQIKVASEIGGLTTTAIIRTDTLELSSIKVSHKLDTTANNLVTRLNFTEIDANNDTMVGHLFTSGEDIIKVSGLFVVNSRDIPERQARELDLGVDLLLSLLG
jgi:hypothetical protein